MYINPKIKIANESTDKNLRSLPYFTSLLATSRLFLNDPIIVIHGTYSLFLSASTLS